MEKKVWNVAMIGGGFMGKAHAAAYAAMPMFFWPPPATPVRKILVDVSPSMAEEGARRYGFAESSSDWRGAVIRPDIDIVDIVTPNDSHAEIAIAAAQAGKHIICEKPLARTSEEARAMLAAVEKTKLVHMIAFNYRRTPAVALAHRYIQQGRIGKILNFRGTYLQDWSADPDGPLSWRFRKAVAGSGALGNIGTHIIDIAQYLVGDVGAVSSMLQTYIPDRPLQAEGLDKLGAAEKKTGGPRGAVDVDDELLTLL